MRTSPAPIPVVEVPPPPVIEPLSPLIEGELPDPVPWPRLNVAVSPSRAWLLAEGPVRDDEKPRRLVTFTFDDGPSPDTTPAVLKLLDRYDIKASFFLIGRYLDGDEPRNVESRELARRILAAGHMIGNHTHDHSLLTIGSRTDALRQIDAGEASIRRATGKTPILFRPPYGGLDAFGEEVLRRRGAELVLWSIEAGDMTHDDPEDLADSIISQLRYAGGGTVLLHDVRRTTVQALPKILEYLKKHAWDPMRPDRIGYEVVDLPRYLRETGARPQPFADRAELEQARSRMHAKKAEAHKPAPPLHEAASPIVPALPALPAIPTGV
jgi:peptidoglycan/xylan/chitin deacetylase (PgdA/CDA1 family)